MQSNIKLYACIYVCMRVRVRECEYSWNALGIWLSYIVKISLSVCLSVCVSVCLSVCLSLKECEYSWDALGIWLSYIVKISLSVCLSVCVSVCLSDCLSVCLSLKECEYSWDALGIWLSYIVKISLSVCLSVCLCVCVSVFEGMWIQLICTGNMIIIYCEDKSVCLSVWPLCVCLWRNVNTADMHWEYDYHILWR